MAASAPSLRRLPAAALAVACLVTLDPSSVAALDADTEVEILAYEDARDANPALHAFLQDPDPATRARAALALGRIGRAEDVAPLAGLLQDPDPRVRRDAAFALGEIPDSTAGFPLEELLLSGFETDAEVRELAVDGLGKLGRGAEACRAALHDGHESVQARALLSAWRIPGSTDTEEILQFSRHKKIEVRWCAAYCLMRMLGSPASGSTPIPGGAPLTGPDRDRIAARLLVLSEEADPRVVLQAVRGLRLQREDAVTTRMVDLLAHDDWRVRVEALRTLAAPLPAPEPESASDGDNGEGAVAGRDETADANEAPSRDETAGADEAPSRDETAGADEAPSRDETDDPTTETDAATASTEAKTAAPNDSGAEAAPFDRRNVPFDVLRPILDDPNPNVVASLIEALARIGGRDSEELLYAQLASPTPRHRELALSSLAARLRERQPPETPAPNNAGGDFARDRDRFFEAIGPLLTDPVWSVSAACIEVGDLLPEDRQGEFYLSFTTQEGRIAKLAVGPYLAWRDGRTTGGPTPEKFQPELTEFLLDDDPMVVLMTLNGLSEAWTRAVAEAESTAASRGDGSAFAEILEDARSRALANPLWSDVRQTIATIASTHVEVAAMETLLYRSAEDPNSIVRRTAIDALESAGRPAPREAGPVGTRHDQEELRAILEWAREDHRAIFETGTGTFEVRLFTRDAPLTCWNFAQLAETGFYDSGSWHRVVPNFVLQDGCPRGDGWGGPPYQIRCEINRQRYGRGALGMALSGKDTGGSQFFFTHSEQPHLDGGYTVFGEIVKGRPVADLVGQGDPITRIRVVMD